MPFELIYNIRSILSVFYLIFWLAPVYTTAFYIVFFSVKELLFVFENTKLLKVVFIQWIYNTD